MPRFPFLEQSSGRLLQGIKLITVVGSLFSSLAIANSQPPVLMEQLSLITNKRPLTVGSRKAGEGYFSPDGKWMSFQSVREKENPFSQIYLLDFETQEIKRISPGFGKATCSWIHPSKGKILFSSTHLDPDLKKKVEEEIEAQKKPRKYSWSFDDQYRLFEYDLKTKKLKSLFNKKGYTAEASYSPDGKRVLFASNYEAYERSLTPEEQELLKKDPSYFMEIYTMKTDGTDLKKLTDVSGYDGGPFYSADGSKITWRRFSKDGHQAEIHVMNADGTQSKAITHLGAMSWAPYFHPSGDYIIFGSNLYGYQNFELMIVDSQGQHDPVRVTSLDGFDGLPVFHPNSRVLSWARRDETGESTIFWADWDDAGARRALGLAPRPPDFKLLSTELRASDYRSWVEFIADPSWLGRRTGSLEEEKLAKIYSEYFRSLGLSPVSGASFIQEFSFVEGVEVTEKNSLEIQGLSKVPLQLKQNFIPTAYSRPQAQVNAAEVSFVGYGIVADASATDKAFDSYSDQDVKGQWVMLLKDIPEQISESRRAQVSISSRTQHKAWLAQQKGAIGVLVVSDLNQQNLGHNISGSLQIPVIQISLSVAQKMLEATGENWTQWKKRWDEGQTSVKKLNGLQVSARVDLLEKKSKGRNVLAMLKVPGAKDTIMIGAHGDHLGRGEFGASLAKGDEQGQIHPGADDNASGVAGVLELAQYLKMQKGKASKYPANFIFAIWSGEELGNLGSTSFLASDSRPIKAYLNLDMIGRLTNGLAVQGLASANEWRALVEKVNLKSGLPLLVQDDPFLPTDAMSFYLKGVPSVSLFTGAHAEYHSPRDRADLINWDGALKVLDVGVDLIREMQGSKISYQKVEIQRRPGMREGGFRIYLGTIPDYTGSSAQGVRISGTTKGSPAERAGLQSEDVIVELAKIQIRSLEDYVGALQSLKANEKTKIKVVRKGTPTELEIVPEKRDN